MFRRWCEFRVLEIEGGKLQQFPPHTTHLSVSVYLHLVNNLVIECPLKVCLCKKGLVLSDPFKS